MIVSRFAPAPTGLLHLGHVVNAIHVWGVTRAAGGRVILRIEDHDRRRSRPEFAAAILEDLRWLGFEPDTPPVRQTDRTSFYEAALTRLAQAGIVYACECSRREIEEAAGRAPMEAAVDIERRYPGTCRAKRLDLTPSRAVRILLEPTVVAFEDLRHGLQQQSPADQCGDLLARDRDGNWSYQFAVTVDDKEQDVTLVVRGDDLLASTGRQLQLARLLGRQRPPHFLHHALIMKSPTQKLSKADRDASVRGMRAAGQTAGQVIAAAAKSAGLVDRAVKALSADAAAWVVAERYATALKELRSRPHGLG